MEEVTNREFKAQMEFDLKSYKELSKALILRSGRNTACFIILMLFVLLLSYFYGIVLQRTSLLSQLLIVFFVTFWGMRLFRAYRDRNGDLAYRRMLSTNNGVPARYEICFSEDGIHTQNAHSGGCSATAYSQLRAIYETKHFLILIQELNLYSAIRKDSITGGTKQELLDFLFQKGTGIKKKKLSSLLFGKIVSVSFIIFSVLSLLLALWFSHPVQSFLHSQQQINNYMSYSAIAEELEELGITGIDDALIAELEAYDQEYDYVYSYDVGNKALDMLCWVGMGNYDDDTWEWTPSDSGVYWFDMEVLSPDTMYTDFLTGIRALDPEALDFSNMTEDLSQVDLMEGMGFQRVSFDWNDTSYTLEATAMYDWFDITLAAELAELVKAENPGSSLYFTYDGGQGVLVFYGTPQWRNAFEKVTGIRLFDDPLSMYTSPLVP